MLDHFPFYLGLMVLIILLIMVANKIKVAYPVLLIWAGLLVSFIPGIPTIHIDPQLIFVIFLPPLLYEAAWTISWKELWRWRRIISSFAFVVVFFTAMTVAWVANRFIPGFSFALGFLLGGIVSPPDAVSAGSILRFVNVPKRFSSILEGESLLNDASSLIIFRFALVAVATGQFIWYQAALNFGWMVIGGMGIGLGIGWIFMKAHKFLPTDTNMDIILTIIGPYVMYIVAEEAHSSGVLAVVSGGLLLSNKRHVFLNSTSRLRGVNFWESLSFMLNGLVFILIGLDLPEIISGLGPVSLTSAIQYGLLVTAVLIITRIISAYGALVVTLIARNFIPVADSRNPGLKTPFLIGWSGMRGVVSLAAALSIPIQLENGANFPQRNLILFITFIVIILTLTIQGISLPYLLRLFKMPNLDQRVPTEEMNDQIQKQLAEQALQHLQKHYTDQIERHPALQQMAKKWQQRELWMNDKNLVQEYRSIYLDILNQQRKWLLHKNRTEELVDEELIRKHLRHLDLEEEKLNHLP